MYELREDRHYSFLENLYTLIFVILPFPFIGIYKTLPVTSMMLWCLLGVLLYGINYLRTRELKFDCYLMVFIFYVSSVALVISVMYGFRSFGFTIKALIAFILLVFNFYWWTPKILHFQLAVKAYVLLTILSSVLLFVQIASAYAGHPFVPIKAGIVYDVLNNISTDFLIADQLKTWRFSSVFHEPAHFAQYALTGLVLILFIAKNLSCKLLKAGFVSAAIVATSSTQGLVMLFCVWGYYFYSKSSRSYLQKLGYILIFALGILLVGFVVATNEVFLTTFMGKWNSVSDGRMVEGTSMYLRTLCGWDIYFDFPFLTKLFGCGLNNVRDYIVTTESGLWCYANNDDILIGYMAGLPRIFCELGLVGAVLYFVFLYRSIWQYRDVATKALALVWFLFMISSASFNSVTTLIPMVFAMCWVKNFSKG